MEVPVKFVSECADCGHKGDAEQFAKAMKEAAFQASVSATSKASDRNRAIDIASKIGGLQEKDSYDREVVDMLAAVTSEILRGHGIEGVDELLAKLGGRSIGV